MKETLLKQFINEKVSKYQPKTREGTPRGEKIGYSLKKFESTLYLLRNEKLKKISEDVGVSLPLLRVWKTEAEFKSLVDKHCQEFSEKLAAYIFEKIRKSESYKIEEDFLLSDSHHFSDILADCSVEKFFAPRGDSKREKPPFVNAYHELVKKLPRSEDKIKALASYPPDNWVLRARI